MTQLVTRIDDDLAARIDRLVADGVVASRSDAVRQGLEVLIDQTQRRRIADAITAGYRRHPTPSPPGTADTPRPRTMPRGPMRRRSG